jgi:predicted TIM-barrel fold metal-dependent hydrolase
VTSAPDNGEGSAANRRYLVISADSHDSPPYHVEKYIDYMDSRYRDEYRTWVYADSFRVSKARFGGPSLLDEVPEAYESDHEDPYRRFWEELWIGEMGVDEHYAKECFERYRPTEPPGFLDASARVASQETQGIVAEVVNTTGLAAGDASQFGANNRELERAGAEAHLRWLADYCGAVPGRLAAPIFVDGRDLDSALRDITWAREHGIFGGVFLPAPRLFGSGNMMSANVQVSEDVFPSYIDPYWEPLWSVCEDLDSPIVLHIGQLFPADMRYAWGQNIHTINMMSAFELGYFAKRPFFQLIAARVFDRHPRLKYCITEIHAASIPAIFEEADHQTLGFNAFQRHGFKLAPSEYWARHGFVAASMLSPREAAIRHEIGIDNLMFGSDYPHPEGTWPNTLTVQRYVLGGLPESDLRRILGENAARCFGFDLEQLRPIADRVGPTVQDLAQTVTEAELPQYTSSYMLNREPARA